MSNDPFAAARHHAGIVFHGAGATLFGYIAYACIASGQAPGLGRYGGLPGDTYTMTEAPMQFWLLVLLHAAASALFARFAWRSWHG